MKDKLKDNNLDSFELQELERKRLAAELHDTSLQDLTHIIHQIEFASLFIDMDQTKAKLELEDVSNQLRKIIQDIRNTIFDLRPMSFDDLGLEEAINEYISFLQKKYSIIINSDIDDINYLDEKKKLAIYRIVQEGLLNSSKHADAHFIKLEIKDNDVYLVIIISDDGKGIDEEFIEKDNTHYGLSILKDRVSYLNGNIVITSNKINGTILMPGETFSYNSVVGERTIAAGYKEAAIYQDGQVIQRIRWRYLSNIYNII